MPVEESKVKCLDPSEDVVGLGSVWISVTMNGWVELVLQPTAHLQLINCFPEC